MKIAIFCSSFPNLSETFIINQVIGLLKLGINVDVITNDIPNDEIMHSSIEEYSLMERIKFFGLGARKSKIHKLTLTIFNLLYLIVKGKYTDVFDVVLDPCLTSSQKMNLISALTNWNNVHYDHVICHFGTNGYYICKMRDLGLITGPISTVFHGFEMSRYEEVKRFLPSYKQLFLKGDLMLPISDLWKKKLIDWGCDVGKVKVHRMGIDINEYKLKPTGKSFSLPLNVVQVGRLTEKKAILDSISAVVKIAKKHPINFTVIGDGELFSSSKELVTKLNATGYIHLLGRQPQEVVRGYLEEADVCLLPSVRAQDGDMEGIPVSLMESMAKGNITVSTYHSGIPELIEHRNSGYLVPESNVDELADCLAEILATPHKEIELIRNNARAVCVEKYNNDILNLQLSKYFNP
ncbi:glycosyltransferase [Aliivibrio finisterrensis]|uniref:glycosyltransferase n=1 Tax=Aliivibrio finisterrensis TaxID=511998 RepID=UPI00101EEBAF|nr:glycosyltransferase [Aliivibrio finisterrensis]RYU65234.1 glycosyltransferase [Aliivibrio finisterrensis]RYU68608.1 glycosyltransferase [Aliivibrio finisterrensis]RYU72001.1 glycosyltransferase [Aliivibrio finisterrensis]